MSWLASATTLMARSALNQNGLDLAEIEGYDGAIIENVAHAERSVRPDWNVAPPRSATAASEHVQWVKLLSQSDFAVPVLIRRFGPAGVHPAGDKSTWGAQGSENQISLAGHLMPVVASRGIMSRGMANKQGKTSPSILLASNEHFRQHRSDSIGRWRTGIVPSRNVAGRSPNHPKLEEGDDPMTTQMWKTGLDVLGDTVAWGAHFCLFYDTKEDLLDTLIPYCKTGLDSQEFCLWVVAEPLTIEEATDALKGAVPDLDRYLADFSIEIVSARDWYLQGSTFDLKRVIAGWHEKLARASARGYAGVRVTGDTAWLAKKNWRDFCEYEEGLNEAVANQRMAVLCTYPLAACGALEILDVVRTHQFALVRRHGSWDVIETAGLKQGKAEIQRLNEELEQRVVERTSQLMRASEALREAQTELAHVNRVTTMGQLAASIAHEVMQPISAGVTNAQAALRWLDAQPPDLEEVRHALGRVVREGNRAGDVIGRIRALIKKAPPRKDGLEINEAVLEVIALTRNEVGKAGVLLRTQLAEGLPLIQGDRVQLQQVMLNLIINALEAMTGVSEGARELLIATREDASAGVLVAVQDPGPGPSPDGFDRLFDAFYTTKSGGMGMGLSICRSIVEAHGGRIWASPNAGPGITVQFSVPITAQAAASGLDIS